jgi:hypothetical protein
MNKAGWSSILVATLVLVFGVAADAQQSEKNLLHRFPGGLSDTEKKATEGKL